MAKHDDDCAGKCRDSIKIGVQHGGNVRDEHVTQHAAADAGQHAEQRSHHRVEAVSERLLSAGYGKERQTGRIEREHEIAKRALALGTGRPEKYHQPGEHRDSEVTPVPECRRRNRTD